MDEDQTDDGKEDGGHQSNQKRSQSNPSHGIEPCIEPNSSHGDDDEELPPVIDLPYDPLPLRRRNQGGSVPNGSDDR